MDFKCVYCSKEFLTKQAYGTHRPRCKLNPNKIDVSGSKNPMFGKKGKNHWTDIDWSTVDFNSLSFKRKRLVLLNESNFTCTSCGFNKTRESGESILEIDHIDGDSSNDVKTNLRVMCPNCHALTDTFRNWGNVGNKKTSSRIRKGTKILKPHSYIGITPSL